MDDLRATYTNEDDDDNDSSSNTVFNHPILTITPPPLLEPESQPLPPPPHSPNQEKPLHLSDDDDDIDSPKSPKLSQDPPPKKQKHLSSFTTTTTQPSMKRMTTKKSKKKGNDIWTKSTSRKGKKKTKNNNNNNNNNINHNAPKTEDAVLITPVPRFPTDDTGEMKICLSKVFKAEKVELSEDRLSAGSSKGYRMVRATRGVVEGAWYYEIKVVKLGETGHTRLGWCMEKGDLQAPVGYDGNSFGYRDIDGSKIHKALREKYGEEKEEQGYKEGDVIGFYICLPEGSLYAPKPPNLVWHKGQRYACATPPNGNEDPPKPVPGSEISFFKNGICQGVAFQNLCGGRYYPAASMYTLPNQPNCVVKFNFGPDFDFFPEDFGSRPIPRPMIEVPYHGFEGRVDNGIPWVSSRMCPMLHVGKEQGC